MNDKPRILIVDDNESICRSLRLIFEKKGYEAETAGTGRAALEKAQGRFFNLALLDIGLPDMAGVELLVPLKEMHPDMVVMMITAYASLKTAVQALNEGASAYITKPLNMDEVLATVREVLEKQRLVQEKRWAEEALRESEQRYRQLFEGISDAVMVYGSQGRFLHCNEATLQRYGYSREEFLRSGAADIVHPDFHPLMKDNQKRIWAGETTVVQSAHRCKDGRVIPVEVNARRIEYRGEPAILAVVRDITERKQAEEELRRLKEFNENIVNSMSEGIAIEDADGYFTFVNPAAAELLGYAPEELLGQHWTAIIPPNQQPIVQAADERRMRGEADRYELELVCKDGKRLSVLVSGSPRFEDGRFVGTMAVFTDITERKQAEEEIRRLLVQTQEQARQMQQIMDTVPEGVLLLDADCRILMANPAAREHLAVLADAEGEDALTHLGGRPMEELLQPAPKGLSHEVELNGPPHRVFEVVAQTMEAEPEARGWVLVVRDVTREREVQQRVQQQEHLAAVGQLAAGIAHDLSNVLTGMIGFAQLLQMSADMPEHAKADLARIAEQGQRGGRLIRQVLDFSCKSTIERWPLDLAAFLEEAARFLERTIPENIHIVLEIDPGDYLVNADHTQLQQVLTNLAVNARDAMPGGGELRLRLSRFTLKPGERAPFPNMGPGEWIALSVSDTGVGISPEVLPHVFEPFFTTKEPGEGTGLGLAQVYGIVKQHDGYIDVESQVGGGTTFFIYLPPLAVQEAPREEAVEEIPHGQGETLLLVEDEPDVLEAGKAMLEHLGYRVLTAGDGQQALEVHAEHKDEIALVLSDMVMPRMGGLGLYQLLRRRDPAIKMVVVTGYPLGEEIRDLLAQGILGQVQKPFLLEQLAQVLHRVLKGQRA